MAWLQNTNFITKIDSPPSENNETPQNSCGGLQ